MKIEIEIDKEKMEEYRALKIGMRLGQTNTQVHFKIAEVEAEILRKVTGSYNHDHGEEEC